MYERFKKAFQVLFGTKHSMKVMVQWAQKDPQGWQEVDASQWRNLPKLPVPARGQRGGQNNQLGWIRNVNVQGLTTEGFDHLAIEPITIGNDEGVKLTVWNDDPDDVGLEGYEPWVSEPQAIVWTILPLAPDPNLGMAINTRQSAVRYCGPLRFARMENAHPKNVSIRPFNEFVSPSEEITRHGVWLENDKHKEHVNKAPQHEWGWMHWCEHLPENETEMENELTHHKISKKISPRRKLKDQRAQGRYRQAEHTITYYQRDTDRAVTYNSPNPAPSNSDALELTTATSSTETATPNSGGLAAWSFSTPANQPNSANWPNGIFHAQLNCTAASGGLTYALSTLTGGLGFEGGFFRVNSALSNVIENQPQDETSFSGTGLKAASKTFDFASGSATDVYTIAVAARGDSHGDAVTLQLNTTDSYADGPWTTETPGPVTDTQNLIITS